MTWPKYLLIAWFAFAALTTIAYVGKPRKPTTPGVAVATVVIAALVITLVVIA